MSIFFSEFGLTKRFFGDIIGKNVKYFDGIKRFAYAFRELSFGARQYIANLQSHSGVER